VVKNLFATINQPIMKHLLTAALCIFSFCVQCFSQDTVQLKRQPYKLKINIDKETFYEEDLKEAPYVWPDNTVQLYPGETVFIEAEVKEGAIVKMRGVKENKHPEKTVAISFTQISNGQVHESMMLKIQNPFQQELVYSAMIFLTKQSRWAKTSVLPVSGGLAAYETWPDAITTIGLGNWSFKKE